MKQHLPSIASAIIAIAFATSLIAGGCTTHGEGGRCDPLNNTSTGNADCDSNLVCVAAADIHLPEGGISEAPICCPSDRSTLAAGDICALNPTTPGSDASIPEAGFETGAPDATTDDGSTSDGETSDAPDDGSDDATDATGE